MSGTNHNNNNNNHHMGNQSTTTDLDDQTPNRLPLDRSAIRKFCVDLSVFVVVLLPVIICEFGIEPNRRGFFCNDEDISYPFKGNTVSPVMLGLLVGLLPLLTIVLVEFVRFVKGGQMQASKSCLGWNAPKWLAESFRQICYFAFGLCVTFDLTEVGKYTIGRLRPHFLAVCQPRLGDGTSCKDAINQYRYVENYYCLAEGYTAADVRQARLSFPSGHSSLAFYAMFYLCMYLHKKISWKGSKLMRHFVQLLLITMAWYTALSRVIDYWHHWSDVLIGSLIGIIMAILTAKYVTKLCEKSQVIQGMRLHIPRQDTTATLQEVLSSHTPPPYSLNTNCSFSNEQYCTKV